MKNLALHWKILIAMLLGVLFGIIMVSAGQTDFVINWVKPLGTIFIKFLKMIAIPLIIVSLIKGIGELKDISKFSTIGGRTILVYICTTLISITVGLGIVHLINPGHYISADTLGELVASQKSTAGSKIENATNQGTSGPLDFIVDMVPDNVFNAMSQNGSMLQVIVFVIFFGISLLLIKKELAEPINKLFAGLNEIILKMVDLIMLSAPIGVFALMASLIASSNDPEVFTALGFYALSVVSGLLVVLCIYLLIVKLYTGRSPMAFLKGIGPAQLIAFSTSSSAATLPVTMERVEEHLGVEKEVSSFVVPVGATINMDGTSLYQGVAAVFISQAMGFDLGMSEILTILFTALMASIGSAAVPGAGVVMLIIVLQAIGFPPGKLELGIAMILAVDRPLDMCRTTINVTGDAMVSMLVAKSVGKLNDPQPKNWDDDYQTN